MPSQGSLDLLYLKNRYQRGKSWVNDWMESHHVMQMNDAIGLSDCHATQLQYQSRNGDGGDASLGVQSYLNFESCDKNTDVSRMQEVTSLGPSSMNC